MSSASREMNVMAPQRRNDVHAVIAYLSSLWGLASGLSLLFPLSNLLLQAVPNDIFVEVQPKTALTPALLTTLATILSLFSILLVISTRRDIADSRGFKEQLSRMRVFAIAAFSAAVVVLLFYLAICNEYRLHYERIPVPTRGHYELFSFFFYPLIFAGFTIAFTALGLREFLQEQREMGSTKEAKP